MPLQDDVGLPGNPIAVGFRMRKERQSVVGSRMLSRGCGGLRNGLVRRRVLRGCDPRQREKHKQKAKQSQVELDENAAHCLAEQRVRVDRFPRRKSKSRSGRKRQMKSQSNSLKLCEQLKLQFDVRFFNAFNGANFGLASMVLADIPGKPSTQTGFAGLTYTLLPHPRCTTQL